MTTLNEQKKKDILALLALGVITIHLDARKKGVQVPDNFLHNGHLMLNFNYKFQECDLDVRDSEVRATLSFNDSKFPCTIPLDAIFGVGSFPNRAAQEIQLYIDSVPWDLEEFKELKQELEKRSGKTTDNPAEEEIKSHISKQGFRVIDGEKGVA